VAPQDQSGGTIPPARELDSDRALLERFQHGDGSAAAAIYERYADRLRVVTEARRDRDLAGRLDADDIIQSAFCSFFRRAAEGSYQVSAGEELWSLLVSITLNKLRSAGDYHRARKRDSRATTSADAALAATADVRTQDARALAELRWLIAEILEPLPDTQQQMIHLRLEGHEVGEIADRTGRSKRTVERNLHDFRQALAARLGQRPAS
jgi:RNA polymerase sigma-70 factor (ECF subfamily)